MAPNIRYSVHIHVLAVACTREYTHRLWTVEKWTWLMTVSAKPRSLNNAALEHLHRRRQRWGAGTEGPPGRRQRQAQGRPRPNWLPALELTGTSPSRYTLGFPGFHLVCTRSPQFKMVNGRKKPAIGARGRGQLLRCCSRLGWGRN